jgi:hypothetical protein
VRTQRLWGRIVGWQTQADSSSPALMHCSASERRTKLVALIAINLITFMISTWSARLRHQRTRVARPDVGCAAGVYHLQAAGNSST